MGIVSKQTLSAQSTSWKWQTKGCTLNLFHFSRAANGGVASWKIFLFIAAGGVRP
jgi:hypothetical protein